LVVKGYKRVGLYSLHATNRKGDFLVKIKNYLFKRKEVEISKSNIPLDFNNETSNLKGLLKNIILKF
jgi:hypothetical protein